MILAGGNIVNYECDIENAIRVGEVVLPKEFQQKTEPKQNVIINQGLSTADEILKLKKLLDDGIITQGDFEQAKSKLISNIGGQ